MEQSDLQAGMKLQGEIEYLDSRISTARELKEDGPIKDRCYSSNDMRGEKRIVIYKSDIPSEEFEKIYAKFMGLLAREKENLEVKMADI